jgi:hypothetical protein
MAACVKCGLELDEAGRRAIGEIARLGPICEACAAEFFAEAEESPEGTAAAIAARIRISKLYRGARSCMAE